MPEFVIFRLSARNSKRRPNKPALELFQNTLNSFFALLIAKRQRQILESEKETLGSFHVGHLRRVRWSLSWEYLINKCARKLVKFVSKGMGKKNRNAFEDVT